VSSAEVQPGVLAHGADKAAHALRLRAFAAIGLVLAIFAAFWPTTASLMERWEDTVARTYTHGYLVVALALWMIWRDRARWGGGSARPFLPGLALVAAGVLAWLIAFRAGLQIVHQAALPALAASVLLTVFGWRMLRGLAFPLTWLYLAIPVWDALLPVLNWISVMAVRLLLRVADIPAYFVNNKFEIPSGTFEIADGCSGLHFFVVALTISLLYGEINRDTVRTRVKLVALALFLAMATNWLRIFIIVIVGHLSEMQHPLVANEHYTFGWYMFAGMMVCYFLVVRRWPAIPVSSLGPQAPEGSPVPRQILAAALLLAAVPVWLVADGNRASAGQLAIAMRDEVPIDPADASLSDWQPHFEGTTREVHGVLHGEEPRIEAHVAGYESQKQGAELVGFGNSLLGEKLRRGRSLPAPAPWTEIVAANGAELSVIWYAYRLDDRWYRSGMRMQLDYGLRSLSGAPAAAVIALRARCHAAECGPARESLQSIIETRYP
jgi:exosortase A